MKLYDVEIDIDSLKVLVEADNEEEALDKAYVKFKHLIEVKTPELAIKGFPIEATLKNNLETCK